MSGPRPIHCAQLIESLGVGGAEQLAVRLANAMAGAGHASHMIVTGDGGPLEARLAPEVRLHKLGFERGSVRSPLRLAGSLARGRSRILSVLQEHGIEIVQAHLPGANFWGLLLSYGGYRAVLPTVHNNREFDYGDSDARLRAWARRRAYAAMVGRCPAVVAVSDEVKCSLVTDCRLGSELSDRIVVVRNGVELAPLRGEADRAAARRRYGIEPGDKVFLAAGRHCEQKNFSDLVRAAHILGDAACPVSLVIAGDGPQRPDLEAAAAHLPASVRVVFPGNVLDLPDLMAAADVFVLPSLWEGLPLVLLEAMAAGLPVIGNRIRGVVDVVTEGREGLLVAAGDVSALATAMASLIVDDAARLRMGASARKRVASAFDFNTTVAQLAQLYGRYAA